MDLEELFETTLKWTLPFWLVPWVFWFFGKTILTTAWNWVTEPENEVHA